MTPKPYMLGPNFHDLNRLVARDEFELQAQVRNTLRLLRPQQAVGCAKVRIGPPNKGGRVLVDDLTNVGVALLLSSSRRPLLERDFEQRGIATPVTLMPPMLALVSESDTQFSSPNMILDLDMNGEEWQLIEDCDPEFLSRFAQITCTFHDLHRLDEERVRQIYFRVFRKLSKFLAPVHLHADNSAGLSSVANVTFPDVLEVTFASRLLYALIDSNEVFPSHLDTPNDPARPDIFLGSFRYEALDECGAPIPVQVPNTADRSADLSDHWEILAKAATERRERLESFGPRAAGILVDSKNGYLVVDAEDSSVGAILLQNGSYADHEYEMARSLIRPAGDVLVVGGHIGAHVVRLAKHCRELVAVEANPRTFRLLEANVRLQGCNNVRLLNMAAGEKDGTIEFLLNRDNTGGSKRRPIRQESYYFYDNPDVVEVICKPLDDVISPDQSFDLIFMDIEGSEYFALSGMQAVLARSKALSVEFLVHHIQNVSAVTIDEFADVLIPHYRWMFIPGPNEIVGKEQIRTRLRAMYDTGENRDCVYFLKEIDPAWIDNRP